MTTEPIDIALRTYIPAIRQDTRRMDQTSLTFEREYPILVFDTETSEDESQNLLFGSCGIWIAGYIHKFYLFHEENLAQKHVQILKRYAETRKIDGKNIEVVSVRWFVENAFFPWIIKNHALCVGFNLPFDLSRLAMQCGYGRGKWRNGFTFTLTDESKYPRIRIRSLDSVRSFFALAPTKYSGPVKGHFLDLRTLGFALTNEKLNLERACEIFDTAHKKSEAEQHGKTTLPYIEYNVNDTLATYDLYVKMNERLKQFKLDIPTEKAFSPASLGKAYLRKIGIRPFLEKNPKFPPAILGYIMTTYYGGRAEVRIRKKPVKVRLMDFKSMYPTLFTLLGLWNYLIAKKIEFYNSTEETRKIVSEAGLNSLTNPSLYPKLVTIVQVQPEDDILPVRAHHGEDKSVYNIGTNYVTSSTPLWYALPDVIASKLLTSKTPKILQAISFTPIGIQDGLDSIEIPGRINIAPEQDFINSLIEYRSEIQRKRDNYAKDTIEYTREDTIQNQLKILANATSYGIFIEINTEDTPVNVCAYGLKPLSNKKVKKREEFGEFFNPILGTLLTSGARLLLAMAEAWLREHGGYYAFCDTDSMAVSPRHWKPLQKFLQSLNPYDSADPILKLEHDERNEQGELPDLWFYGISAKRYVLYRLVDGKPIIVDDGWSSHGLGHLLHDSKEENTRRNDWEKELWTRIIRCENGELSERELCGEYSGQYAVSRYAVTKPSLHRRLKAINQYKDYSKQIKPHNFVLIGQPTETDGNEEPIHPITKFTKNIDEAPFQPFIDYNTGKHHVCDTQLYWKELPDLIREYLNHHEAKFQNGHSTGRMRRRQLVVDKIAYIGKEANEVEETEILAASEDAYVKYE